MGVPKFFRYMSERYPCLSERIKECQIPDFDNLYLDMNGLIHACSHPKDFDPYLVISEEKIFTNIFRYIEVLFNLIKPRKLFFLAVDGVAPRAKMNQQRARRFRSAKETELYEKKVLAEGGKPLPKDRFDTSKITPGTVFMYKLHNQLRYFIISKISSDPLWQGCQIILSGHQTPGEGEHKIMEYIRYLKAQPDYNPNTKHCLYGLDADLIMLGLCTHEPNFCILREKVDFSKSRKVMHQELEFHLFHLSLLRDYLDLEFEELKKNLSFEYDLEKIIDDWILMGLLVGNDFIPNLPHLHINNNAFPILYKAYKEVLPTLDGYLNENGYLNLPRFEVFMQKLAAHDLEIFREIYADLAFLEEKAAKYLMPDKENSDVGRKSDLEKLIESTNAMFLEPEEDSFEDEGDTFFVEFQQHKRNYYLNKLECPKVTEEVLRSQAEGYVRAIQWNLHYYYQGCRSWSWYYPHHYSPYISDITNFKNLKLDFELGKPFLPFEQLLAVLPASSKNLLPKVFGNLMTSSNSPIKDFYPEDFETDLNGKRNDWEAVVLIPFIDEKRLLEAMEPLNKRLTPDELRRNCHLPISVFTYTEDDLGLFRSPQYFPPVSSNHALVREVSPEEISVPESRLKYGLRPGVLFGVFSPVFPTLKHVPHTASLKKAKVKVFNFPSNDDSMVLTIERKSCPSVEELAKTLLGKIIYVNWPYLVESRVLAVADEERRFTLTEDKIKSEIADQTARVEWEGKRISFAEHYMNRYAVDVGPTDVLVYVSTLEGQKYTCSPTGKITKEKLWSSSVTACPFQIVVKDMAVLASQGKTLSDLKDAFPVGSVAFMLGRPHFGSMARILESPNFSKYGRLNVSLELVENPRIDDGVLKFRSNNSYLSCRNAAQKLNIDSRLLSRLTGSLFVEISNDGQPFSEATKVNIGLNLKFNKKNLELPGYTKKTNDVWLYSLKAIDLVSEYLKKFTRVVERLSQNLDNDSFFEKDIFPGPHGANEMKELLEWLKNQDHNKSERITSGTEVVESEVIAELEKLLDKFKAKTYKMKMQIKPHLLYKSDLVYGKIPPVSGAKHCLLDRIVYVRSSYSVPTGLRGFIVGIHKGAKEDDNMYDILFDKPFPCATKLQTSEARTFRMSNVSFINITDSNRNFRHKSVTKKVSEGSISVMDSTSEEEKAKAQPSAFAQWNQPRTSTGNGDRFQQIWSDLQIEKPRAGTDVLKRILKIDGERKPDIDETVKFFFENLIKVPESSAGKPTEPRDGEPNGDQKNYIRLLSFCQKNRLGSPKFNYLFFKENVVAQIYLDNGRVCSGLPCADKKSACESASLLLLTALGEISPQKNSSLDQKNSEKEVVSPGHMCPSQSVQVNCQGQPEPKSIFQRNNHRGFDVPQGPPDPPPRWVGPKPPSESQGHTKETPKKESGSDFQEIKSPDNNRKLLAPAFEFVPLQAIIGKRSTSTFLKSQIPSFASAGQRPTETRNKSVPVAPVAILPAVASHTQKKPRRRPKIAANLALDFNLYPS